MSKLSRAIKYQRRQKAMKKKHPREMELRKSIWLTDTETDNEEPKVNTVAKIDCVESNIFTAFNKKNSFATIYPRLMKLCEEEDEKDNSDDTDIEEIKRIVKYVVFMKNPYGRSRMIGYHPEMNENDLHKAIMILVDKGRFSNEKLWTEQQLDDYFNKNNMREQVKQALKCSGFMACDMYVLPQFLI